MEREGGGRQTGIHIEGKEERGKEKDSEIEGQRQRERGGGGGSATRFFFL